MGTLMSQSVCSKLSPCAAELYIVQGCLLSGKYKPHPGGRQKPSTKGVVGQTTQQSTMCTVTGGSDTIELLSSVFPKRKGHAEYLTVRVMLCPKSQLRRWNAPLCQDKALVEDQSLLYQSPHVVGCKLQQSRATINAPLPCKYKTTTLTSASGLRIL